MKTVDERIADFVGEHRIVDPQRRDARQRAGAEILDGRLGRRRQGNRLAVATEAGGQPQEIDSVFQRVGGRRQVAQWPNPQTLGVTLLPTAPAAQMDRRPPSV